MKLATWYLTILASFIYIAAEYDGGPSGDIDFLNAVSIVMKAARGSNNSGMCDTRRDAINTILDLKGPEETIAVVRNSLTVRERGEIARDAKVTLTKLQVGNYAQ